MRVLEVETERQKAELAKARMDEEIRKMDKQHHSALTIQRTYRGYRSDTLLSLFIGTLILNGHVTTVDVQIKLPNF